MPETSVTPTLATATTGKSLIYVGGGYYGAWSGAVGVTDTETTLIEFVSPEDALVANIRFYFVQASGDDFFYKVYLNDLEILNLASQSTSVIYQNVGEFIIPSLTKVKVTADNDSSSSSVLQAAIMVAKSVYGKT